MESTTSIEKLFGSECNQIDFGPKGQRWWGRKLSEQTGAGLCCEPRAGWASHSTSKDAGEVPWR